MNALVIGTGEYTTGYVHNAPSSSDKRVGIVALTLFDLRRRGLIDRLYLAGTNGTKFPGIRAHLQQNVADVYRGLDVQFDSFPADDVTGDPQAYRKALQELTRGDVVLIFTPDDLHFQLAMDAIERGCHVLVAKPIVKTLSEHRRMADAARNHGSLVAMEVHKRWDPIYRDAHDRIRELGEFSYFSSYMSQPKSQLDTFRSWAGKSSDISYYLNSHHVDFHVWSARSVRPAARPARVFASAASGVAKRKGIETEDTITLNVTWTNEESGCQGIAVYTASWIAPRSDVHSQQRFHYMGQKGEVLVDQAHRGYTLATDDAGFSSPNPLFMKYTPNERGEFAGQDGYGYRSIAEFVEAADLIRRGRATAADFDSRLATVAETMQVSAILEAGRISLDRSLPVDLIYDDDGTVIDLRVMNDSVAT